MGLPVDDVEFKPMGMDESERLIAVEAVNNAEHTPFAVAESKYKK